MYIITNIYNNSVPWFFVISCYYDHSSKFSTSYEMYIVKTFNHRVDGPLLRLILKTNWMDLIGRGIM